MIGFIEWACIRVIAPHLDWPREQSVGTHVSVSHEVATPPGLEVTAWVKLVEVDGRRLVFEVKVSDEAGVIGRGTHERHVVDAERFAEKMARKTKTAGS